MTDFQPSRQKSDLADVVEMLLDKGVVINADIAVSIGDTQLLGIQVRAAIASFDTAARYGLEFPEGTDMRRMAEAIGEPELAEMDRPRVPVDPTRGVNVTAGEKVADEGEREGDGDDGAGSDTDDESGADANDRDGPDDEGSATNDESGLLGGDDRGTERLGARPDPDQPAEGGFDLVGDEDDDSIGSGLLEDDVDEGERSKDEERDESEPNEEVATDGLGEDE